MRASGDLRERMAAAGVALPAEVADAVVLAAGPMITSLDDLAELALGDLEPFAPLRQLTADAR